MFCLRLSIDYGARSALFEANNLTVNYLGSFARQWSFNVILIIAVVALSVLSLTLDLDPVNKWMGCRNVGANG